jgi:hypothetical protein
MEERQQINVESMVGSKVMIQLHRQAYDTLELQGVESERFVARIAGLDGFGVWIENPNFCTVPTYDDNGEYIEPEQRQQICDRAVILIMWPNIQTILQFPDRAHYRGETPSSEIGFRARLQPATVVAQELTPIGAAGSNGVASSIALNGKSSIAKPAKGKGKKGGKHG